MKIDNIKIYDLDESIVASGLPMQAMYSEKAFANEVYTLYKNGINSPHFRRAVKLANTPVGSGHGNFLSGVLVS